MTKWRPFSCDVPQPLGLHQINVLVDANTPDQEGKIRPSPTKIVIDI